MIPNSDIISITQQLASLNVSYLQTSVTVIILAGGFYYWFTAKPLKEKIDILSEELRLSFKTTKSELETFKKDSESRTAAVLKEISDLGKKVGADLLKLTYEKQKLELSILMSEYWSWRLAKNDEGALMILIEYMEMALRYNIPVADEFWLTSVCTALKNLGKYTGKDKIETQSKLVTILNNPKIIKIKEYDRLKESFEAAF